MLSSPERQPQNWIGIVCSVHCERPRRLSDDGAGAQSGRGAHPVPRVADVRADIAGLARGTRHGLVVQRLHQREHGRDDRQGADERPDRAERLQVPPRQRTQPSESTGPGRW